MKKALAFILALLLITAGVIYVAKYQHPTTAGVVATVGPTTISAKTLKDNMVHQYRILEAAQKQSLKTRLNILEHLIDRRLKVLEARARGYDELPEIVENHRGYLNDQASRRLYEMVIIDQLANDERIQDYYDHDQWELKASHILLKWPKNATARDSSDLLQRAREIYREAVVPGADFAELARKYSEEPGADKRGGSLGWFGWNKMVPEFQEAAWSMHPGEISEPVKTRFGYHIIKLEDRRHKDLQPLPEIREQIKQEIVRTNRSELDHLVQTYLQDTRKRHQLQYQGLDSLLNILKNVPPKSGGSPFSVIKNQEWVVATSTVKEVTVADLDKKILETPGAPPKFGTIKELENTVDAVLIPLFLQDDARARGLYQDPEVIAAAEERLERDLEEKISKEEIDPFVQVKDEELQLYYDAHRDEFMSKEKVKVQEIFVGDRKLAEDLRRRIDRGEDFSRLAAKYTERNAGGSNSAKKTKGVLPPFTEGRYGAMGAKAFAMNVGEVAGPIKLGAKYSIIKLLEKIPPKPKPFSEVKYTIRSTLLNQKRDEAEKTLHRNLLEKYPVVVDTEAVKRLFM